MISKSLALQVLNAALSTGGDYAEIYCEQTDNVSITLENGKVDSTSFTQKYGCGIRILNKLQSVYGFTSDLGAKSLLDLATTLAASFDGKPLFKVESIQKQKVKTIS